jgi:hypothetical protein
MSYNFTNDDVQYVEKAIDLKNKGFFIDGTQLTEVYNRVLNKRANPTNCGSCIRQRIIELEGALNAFKRTIELEKKQEPTPIKQEENNAVRKPKNKK